MTKKERSIIGLKADETDEEITKDILRVFRDKELTVDRASRVLEDAQVMLPLMAKLPAI